MFLALRSQWEAAAAPAAPGQPTSGGPLHACDVKWIEFVNFIRLQATFRIGRYVTDPFAVRVILHDPWGKEMEEWWPGSLYLVKVKPGVYVLDLDPLTPGEWAYRVDSWGPVATFQLGGMELQRKPAGWQVTPVRLGYVLPVNMRVALL